MTVFGSVILIGPSKAGKSTLARRLGELADLPVVDLDDLRWDYYAEIVYDPELGQKIRRAGGMKALAAHWKPYDIHALERVLADYPTGHIIAFGAGHSVYEDPDRFARAQKALERCLVLLIQPSLDLDEACRIIRQRIFEADGLPDEMLDRLAEGNRYFMEHPSNRRLARHTILTGDKTVDEACAEILPVLKLHMQDE